MSRVAELIDLIVQGKNAEASEVLNSELLNRSYQQVSDHKPHVAADYFSGVVGQPEPEVEDDSVTPQEEEPQDETN